MPVKLRDSRCFISLELDGDLAVDKPLAEMASILRKLADEIASFEEGQTLDEVVLLRVGRKRVGQADFYVDEPTP